GFDFSVEFTLSPLLFRFDMADIVEEPGRHYHGSRTGLGWSRAPRDSLGNYAETGERTHNCRGEGRRAGRELGGFLPAGWDTRLLGVP
ncbi:hypothetical protein A2U01_0076556, partial [Trifolium medium]|nr:hypothetical protein [Trifolium medium]